MKWVDATDSAGFYLAVCVCVCVCVCACVRACVRVCVCVRARAHERAHDFRSIQMWTVGRSRQSRHLILCAVCEPLMMVYRAQFAKRKSVQRCMAAIYLF